MERQDVWMDGWMDPAKQEYSTPCSVTTSLAQKHKMERASETRICNTIHYNTIQYNTKQ